MLPFAVTLLILSTPISRGAPGEALASSKIAENLGGLGSGTLMDGDNFGRSCASIGDLDRDGIPDLVVGSINDDSGGPSRGAVYILFLNADGSVKTRTKIAHSVGGAGAPSLTDYEHFGTSCTVIGDLDGDNIVELAVGAPGNSTGGFDRGAVYILFLNIDGTVKLNYKIESGTENGPNLSNFDVFGSSCAGLGDLDGDEVPDLAVGAEEDKTGGSGSIRGAVHILFLDIDGSVKSSEKIAHNTGGPGAPTLNDNAYFGSACTSLGDLDGDTVPELAVGSLGDDTGGIYNGAVHVLFMNANGSVKASTKIASGTANAPVLDFVYFGCSCANVGDLNRDGVTDIAVGAYFDLTGGFNRGAVYILFLNANGSIKSHTKIAHNTGGAGAPVLADTDQFGRSCANLGDIDGDGSLNLAVGADQDDTGGEYRGAVHMLEIEIGSPPSVDNRAKVAITKKIKKLKTKLKSAKRRKQATKAKRFKKQIKALTKKLRAL